jgi:hypothetical protein
MYYPSYKHLMICLLVITLFTECTMNSSFWHIIEVDLKENEQINAIQGIGTDSIFYAGAITKDGSLKVRDAKPFIRMTFDGGKNWKEKMDLQCNVVNHLLYNANTLIIDCLKYSGDSSLSLNSKRVYYKFNTRSNSRMKLDLPTDKSGTIVQIIDSSTYILNATKNQFGNTYLKTSNAGETWQEYLVLMPSKRDMFSEKCLYDNKMWGVRTHHSDHENPLDFQSLVSVDIETWNIIDEIPLGRITRDEKGYPITTHWIADIKTDGVHICLLGKDQVKNDKGYIWKVDIVNKKIAVQDSFELTADDIPSDLFFFNQKVIVKYTTVSSLFPKQTLLYKDSGEKSWRKEYFPDLTYPIISFNNGKLMGVAQKNKIYFKQF